MVTTIQFIEGSFHTVVITVNNTIILDGKKADLQIRNKITDLVLLEFTTENNTLEISGQNIVCNIPANVSAGKAANGLWQLKIYTNDVDAIKSESYDCNIIKSTNRP
jgi:hypothetical protein